MPQSPDCEADGHEEPRRRAGSGTGPEAQARAAMHNPQTHAPHAVDASAADGAPRGVVDEDVLARLSRVS